MRRDTTTLLDRETGELRIKVACGLTPEQIARGRYKIGEGIVGRVVEKGEPMVILNVRKEPLFLKDCDNPYCSGPKALSGFFQRKGKKRGT